MLPTPASIVAMIEPPPPWRVVTLTGGRELTHEGAAGVGVAGSGVLDGADVAVGGGVAGVPVGASGGVEGVPVGASVGPVAGVGVTLV